MCLKLCVPDQTIDIRPRKMSKFFRFFSRRRTGRGVKSDQTDHGHPLKKKNAVQCTVMLLDGTDFSTELHVSPVNIISVISCFEMRYPRNYGIYHVYIQYDIFNTAGQTICWHIIKYWLFSRNHISYFFYQCKYLLVIQQSISVQHEVHDMSLNHSPEWSIWIYI